MSHTVKLGHTGYHLIAPHVLKKLQPCTISPHLVCYSSTSGNPGNELVIKNVVEETPVRYRRRFNHERGRRPELTRKFAPIVFKKKDLIPVIYPTLEERLDGNFLYDYINYILFIYSDYFQSFILLSLFYSIVYYKIVFFSVTM